jgi:hypothetical protein
MIHRATFNPSPTPATKNSPPRPLPGQQAAARSHRKTHPRAQIRRPALHSTLGASLVETDEHANEYDFISRDQHQSGEKFSVARLTIAATAKA